MLYDTKPKSIHRSDAELITAWNETFNLPEFLMSCGEDLGREGLLGTPERLLRAWKEQLAGYNMVPEEIIKQQFDGETGGMLICRNIAFTSMCEHHLMNFSGRIHIGYEPNADSGRVCGLSKMARLVECFSKRLQMQERICDQLLTAMYEGLEAKAVVISVCGRHMCCQGRGVRQFDMDFVTTKMRGDTSNWLINQTVGEMK